MPSALYHHSNGQTQNICLHFYTVSWVKLARLIILSTYVYVPPQRKLERFCNVVVYTYSCTANNKLHSTQCFWRSQQLHSSSANMEQEASLPCAQQPSTCPYPEQDASNNIPRPSIYLTSILILSYHLRLRTSSGFLLSCCPPNIYNLYFKHVSCSQ